MRSLNAASVIVTCLACLLGLNWAAQPAAAGEGKEITGFDTWVLGSALPADGDEFYSLFSGPLYEDLETVSLTEYETIYSLEMPSGTYLAKVTVGYGPELLLDAIIVDFNSVDEQVLTTEQAEALAADILQVWADNFSDELLMLDSLPGGPDRREDAMDNAGVMILGDELGSTAWLNWNGAEVLVMYTTKVVGDEMIDNFNAAVAGSEPEVDLELLDAAGAAI
jgi:hypothetical protein